MLIDFGVFNHATFGFEGSMPEQLISLVRQEWSLAGTMFNCERDTLVSMMDHLYQKIVYLSNEVKPFTFIYNVKT